ncbi:MAG: glycosyltransferase [Mycobacterium sp.]|nr:glycosyltransferase [Mycobacterium sp.]
MSSESRARGFPAASPPDLHEIVIVVPAHNERDRLPDCLDSIGVAARSVTVSVRVVVVLDTCTDGSESVLPPWVSAIRMSARNVGAARAAGFVSAAPNADHRVWLATTDADSVVPTTWLADQIRHHRARMHGVVGTVAVDWREHATSTRRRYEGLYLTSEADHHGHVHGANLGVRADAYWRVGGFRPLSVGEDVDLVERLVSARTPLVWDADNAVLTSDRRDSRARGGFGDYVRALADDDIGASAESA